MAQSLARGYIARKKYKEEYGSILENKDKIIKLQAAMRGYMQKKKYNDRKNYLKENEASVVKVKYKILIKIISKLKIKIN